jgi:integrase
LPRTSDRQAAQERRPALLPDGLRFYDLRHTCASLLIAQGASVKAVQAQLGHATASITLDTYGHPFPSETEALADRLEMVRDAAIARAGADPARTHGQRPEGNRRWMTRLRGGG